MKIWRLLQCKILKLITSLLFESAEFKIKNLYVLVYSFFSFFRCQQYAIFFGIKKNRKTSCKSISQRGEQKIKTKLHALSFSQAHS